MEEINYILETVMMKLDSSYVQLEDLSFFSDDRDTIKRISLAKEKINKAMCLLYPTMKGEN